jgi:hypothetical protein
MVNVYDESYDQRFVLGVLNSKITRRLWLERFYDQRRTFPKIKGRYLEDLPMPIIAATASDDHSPHDKMVQFVEQVLESNKKLAGAQTEREKSFYENKRGTLERQIDEIVYSLFDLNAGEIDVVEQM